MVVMVSVVFRYAGGSRGTGWSWEWPHTSRMFVMCGLLESNKYEEREENIWVCSVVIFLLATCLINFLKKQAIRVSCCKYRSRMIKTDLVPLHELGKLSILKQGHKSASAVFHVCQYW